jgi:ribosomal protein S15P/S13E
MEILMKKFLQVTSTAILLATSITSYADLNKEAEMTSLTQEIRELKDNIKEYSQDKYETYSLQAKKIIDQQKKLVLNMKVDQKLKFDKQILQIEKEMDDLNNASSYKKEELYKEIIAKLEKLNIEISD